RDAQLNYKQFADKGRNILLNSYIKKKFKSGVLPKCYFYTLIDFLLKYYILTRGGDRRSTKISDLFTFKFKGKGLTRCIPLIFTTRASNRLETISALYYKNPLIYILSGLAFYLLY
ncbi:hypothetical protein K432DRAFT_314242, partial [Lepidopterella palustris CBS 459.81]